MRLAASIAPFGQLALAAASAARTSSRPMPYLNSARRVELDAHRRQRAPPMMHLADALDLRQILLQDVRGGVVDLAAGQRVRGQRQDQDRRVGRIDLAVGRVAAQARRQVGPRGVDRRLHIARGAVDVAVEAELQGDARRADRTGARSFR